jgi:streptogramin lyase
MQHTILASLRRRISIVGIAFFTAFIAGCGGGGDQVAVSAPFTTQSQAAPGVTPQVPPADPLQPAPGSISDPPILGPTRARFNAPTGIALAPDGDLYVVDSGNHVIRRITSTGLVTTIAGLPGVPGIADGTGAAARFNDPHDIAIDGANNLYVTDRGSHTIRRVTPGGIVTTLAGTAGIPGSADAAGIAARFNLPTGIAVDPSGSVYVADTENYLIRRITPSGLVGTVAGIRNTKGISNGDLTQALLANVLGITSGAAGDLFFTDGFILPPEPNLIQGSTIVRRISQGGMVSTYAGTLAPEGGNYADGAAPNAKFYLSHDLVADRFGSLYIADSGNDAIRKIGTDGIVTTLIGPNAGIDSPRGITIDPFGNIYFTDTGNHVVRRLTPSGLLTTIAGTIGAPGFADAL